MLQCAIVVLQYTNRGPTPRAMARVALGVYPPLPPARLSACIVLLFGCVHIQSQAREIRRLVACTR
jgi:hypothetical protein